MSIVRAYAAGKIPAVKELLKNNPKTNVNEQDELGNTIGHLVLADYWEMPILDLPKGKEYIDIFIPKLEYLLQIGYDPKICDLTGVDFLDMVLKRGFFRFGEVNKIAELFLKYCPELNLFLRCINESDLVVKINHMEDDEIQKFYISKLDLTSLPLTFLTEFLKKIETGYFSNISVKPEVIVDLRKRIASQIYFNNNYPMLNDALCSLFSLNDLLLRGMLLNSEELPIFNILVNISDLDLPLKNKNKEKLKQVLADCQSVIVILQRVNAIPQDLAEDEKIILTQAYAKIKDALNYTKDLESGAKSFSAGVLAQQGQFAKSGTELRRDQCANAAARRMGVKN